jgi:hypothetical protein
MLTNKEVQKIVGESYKRGLKMGLLVAIALAIIILIIK